MKDSELFADMFCLNIFYILAWAQEDVPGGL